MGKTVASFLTALALLVAPGVAHAADVVRPGDTVTFPDDVLPGSLPAAIYIRPQTEPLGSLQTWRLDVRSQLVSILDGDERIVSARVSFVAPQLPRGTYVAWFPATAYTPSQSLTIEIHPGLATLSASYAQFPTRLPYLKTNLTVTVALAGPATGPTPAYPGGTTPAVVPPASVTLANTETTTPLHAMLAGGQASTVVPGADGVARWRVNAIVPGAAAFTATAPGFDPLTFFVKVLDPKQLSPEFFVFRGQATADIQGVPTQLVTNPFTITVRFSYDRTRVVIVSFPDLGPGDSQNGYKITMPSGGIGSFAADTFDIPMLLRYGGNVTIFGWRACCDPSDVGIDLTDRTVSSTHGVFAQTGSRIDPTREICDPVCKVPVTLVGAGVFQNGALAGADIRHPDPGYARAVRQAVRELRLVPSPS